MYTPVRDQSIFNLKDNLLVPSGLAKGPWYPNTQHGSAMIGLMARAAENHPTDTPRLVSRLTVDMIKAAPMAPISVKTEAVSSGKSVEFLNISMLSEGEVFLRATAMRIRVQELPVDDFFKGAKPFPILPEPQEQENCFFAFPHAENIGFHHAVDVRVPKQTEGQEAAPMLWFRLATSLVEGEETSAYQQLAMSSDWTYAVPKLSYFRKVNSDTKALEFSSINPEVTINYFRPPVGEWIGLRAQPSYGDFGSGCVSAQLFDKEGPVGFSSQSVLIRGLESGPMHTKVQ